MMQTRAHAVQQLLRGCRASAAVSAIQRSTQAISAAPAAVPQDPTRCHPARHSPRQLRSWGTVSVPARLFSSSPPGPPTLSSPSTTPATPGANATTIALGAQRSVTGSDAGAEFSFSDPDAPKRSTWRRNIAVIALIGGLMYHAWDSRKQATERLNNDLVSCLPNEIHDLINVFNFTTKDMESLYARTIQRYPRGLVSIDDFSVLLAQQVQLVRERRKREREARAKERVRSQYLDDREEVILERRLERAQAAGQDVSALRKELDAIVERNEAREAARERAAQSDVDEAAADAHADNAFVPIDTFVFFRTTTPRGVTMQIPAGAPPGTGPQRQQLLDVRDVLVAYSGVLFDHAPLDERLKEREGQSGIPSSLEELQTAWTPRELEVFSRTPTSKLHFAFRLADEDRDGRISLSELERLIGRLIRTGHVHAHTLLKRTEPMIRGGPDGDEERPSQSPTAFLPLRYEARSPAEIAEGYWERIIQRRRWEAYQAWQALRAKSPGSAGPAPSLPSTIAGPDTRLTWPEILEASRTFTARGYPLGFWYLAPLTANGTAMGSFARWRMRRKLAWEDVFHRVPDEREAARINKDVGLFLA